jgi:hypothetical protein
MMSKYAACQLAWSAQALNATIGNYAKCDTARAVAIQENWHAIEGFKEPFAKFLSSLVEGRGGYLNLGGPRQAV